jgi:hypothetical protein
VSIKILFEHFVITYEHDGPQLGAGIYWTPYVMSINDFLPIKDDFQKTN